MIRSLGYEYKVKLNVVVEISVTGHDDDDASDNAMEEVESALNLFCESAEAEVLELTKGEEALDITEDDES